MFLLLEPTHMPALVTKALPREPTVSMLSRFNIRKECHDSIIDTKFVSDQFIKSTVSSLYYFFCNEMS